MRDTMTVAQALRHARHDFLNELQLVKMNMDLGRPEQVQAIIRSHAEAAVQLERLAGLGVPQTEAWALTAKWRFPEIRFRLECLATSAPVEADGKFADALEQLSQSVRQRLDPVDQLECRITLTNDSHKFVASVQIERDWQNVKMPESEDIQVVRACASNETKFVFSAQMEG
ncbi:Spo0B domain-containing protein [Planococcus salinus]|uniref:Sporulation protein n=1 Tax=Planococcus salinus TaxID=1848460 RepID=A0A3M8PBF2_9BACL|nr:Spo0B domain-containing protein [Planococcus salinus]RNF40952.1 sporulation protein [Planococcus salinus]